MNCPCGGTTTGQKATCRGAHLLYECCGGCGRCGQWVLIRDGRLLAVGEHAREQLEALRASRSRPVPARAEDEFAEDELADLVSELLEGLP